MSDSLRSALCNAVDGSVLLGHLREFARWIKLSGTPDEMQSLSYVQDRMNEYGYRTDRIMHNAYISLPGASRVDVTIRASPASPIPFRDALPQTAQADRWSMSAMARMQISPAEMCAAPSC